MKVRIEYDKLFSVVIEGEKHIELPVAHEICNGCIRGEVESITVPNGVRVVDDLAFSHSNASEVTLPRSVAYIGKYILNGIKKEIVVNVSSLIGEMHDKAFVPESGAKIICNILSDHLSLPQDFTISLFTVVDKADGVEGAVTTNDGLTVIKKTYTKEEYLLIKEDSLKYMPTFYSGGSYYKYYSDGRAEYQGEAIYTLPFVSDDQILVKNGEFIGMIFNNLIQRKVEFVPIYKDSDKFTLMFDDSYSDEWGRHGSSNYCKLTFVGNENPREMKTFIKSVKI